MVQFVFVRAENIVEIGENAGFLLSTQCFLKALRLRVVKSWDVC